MQLTNEILIHSKHEILHLTFYLRLRKLVLEVKQIVSHLRESSQGSAQCDLSAEITGTCNNYNYSVVNGHKLCSLVLWL